ncbi:MAG: 16S rRNA (cytidine(1402)-2'-O)-methyltransferase [Bacillota bacterium]
MTGKLFLCPTPIGNLDDMTYRAVKVLKEVDLIACEDTRRTGKLLKHFEIKNDLLSYHEHNEQERSREIITKLEHNMDIALVSDAGTPGISDPGEILVQKAVKAGITIIPLPGPSAVLPALIVSGFSTDRFVFEGFLPRKGEARENRLADLKLETRTTVVYESPYRTKSTVTDLAEIMPEREIVLVREISKLHEEILRGTTREMVQILQEREIKGEIVLVLSGRPEGQVELELNNMSVLNHLKLLIDNGYTKKKAIKEVAEIRGIPKSQVYKEAIAIEARPEFRE